jgi:glycine/D-amino acid oxidase-like deaminating enzyme
MPWTTGGSIFSKDFKAKPYWWDSYTPAALPDITLPKDVAVAIIGAGYAGLNAALELAKHGIEALVLDAAEPGFGASTRNGGLVSGGVNVGKRMLNKALTPEEATPLLQDAADAFTHVEDLISQNAIDCGWHKRGYFLGAWCRSHYDGMAKKLDGLNSNARSEAFLVPKDMQHMHIGSDYYHGGMVVGRSAHLHPALFYKGLLGLAQKAGVAIASNTPVTGLAQGADGSWQLQTRKGTVRAGQVIVASNGYTGDVTPHLKRRVVPVASYLIATEELPEGLAANISPQNHSIADTRRVLTYYRLSPDGKRLIFGGRAKFGPADSTETASVLHRFMLDRFPQLKGTRITHAWTGNVAFTFDELPHLGQHQGLHYALGCNGSGIAMMSYLGREVGRKLAGKANRRIAFDREDFPGHPLYRGSPWFVPVIGAWFRLVDQWDRRFH